VVKKKHTIKHLMLNDENNHVHFLSEPFEGSMHDKRCADEVAFLMPEGTEIIQDTGFQGLDIPNVTTHQPTKKPRGKELTAQQKHENREISRQRIGIEHSIGGTKVFRVVKETLRLRSSWLRNVVMEVCVGLFNIKNYYRREPC
jgi:hypothetical protein